MMSIKNFVNNLEKGDLVSLAELASIALLLVLAGFGLGYLYARDIKEAPIVLSGTCPNEDYPIDQSLGQSKD